MSSKKGLRMKTFLETWLHEAPAILQREISNQALLIPSQQLPSPESAISLAVLVAGATGGRFTVAADGVALHSLFVEARMTESESDAHRDHELWREFLRQTATVVAQAFAGAQVVSIEDAPWSLGLPSAAYELCLGNVKMRLAFTDDVSSSVEGQVLDTNVHASSGEAFLNSSQRGVDRLL